jgi:hypothetical protein
MKFDVKYILGIALFSTGNNAQFYEGLQSGIGIFKVM